MMDEIEIYQDNVKVYDPTQQSSQKFSVIEHPASSGLYKIKYVNMEALTSI